MAAITVRKGMMEKPEIVPHVLKYVILIRKADAPLTNPARIQMISFLRKEMLCMEGNFVEVSDI